MHSILMLSQPICGPHIYGQSLVESSCADQAFKSGFVTTLQGSTCRAWE